jgi:hypothetical protein
VTDDMVIATPGTIAVSAYGESFLSAFSFACISGGLGAGVLSDGQGGVCKKCEEKMVHAQAQICRDAQRHACNRVAW